MLTVVFGGVSLLLFAAGNIYYARRMSHAPCGAAAPRNPAAAIFVILAGITALVFGGLSRLIFLRRP